MKQVFASVILAIMAISSIFLVSCARPEAPAPKPQVQQPKTIPQKQPVKKPGDYFPLTKNSTWQYQGEGSEFANFTMEVLFTKGNLAQTSIDPGGTVSSAVFKTTGSAVTRTFFQGEGYEGTNFLDEKPNDTTVILKAPLEIGTKWVEPNGSREIVDVNSTVDTPAGKFEKCIKLKIARPQSTTFEYFKDGVGMVKRKFISEETRVISTLESYTIR